MSDKLRDSQEVKFVEFLAGLLLISKESQKPFYCAPTPRRPSRRKMSTEVFQLPADRTGSVHTSYANDVAITDICGHSEGECCVPGDENFREPAVNPAMEPVVQETLPSNETLRRSEELFREEQGNLGRRTDRMFAWLTLVQWLATIAVAVCVAPHAWNASQGRIRGQLQVAVFLGGALSVVPALLAWRLPGITLTRHAVAVGQMLISGLLIQFTGGHMETRFHVFGS